MAIEFFVRLKGYFWDPSRGVYISKWNHAVVKETTVLRSVEKFMTNVQDNVSALTESFLTGKMKLQDWQVAMAQEIKDAYSITSIVGRGGRSQMASQDWGRLGARLRWEYSHLNGLAMEIQDATLTEAQILNRADKYAKGCRRGYYDGLTSAKKDSEMAEEIRLLDPNAQNCGDCINYASAGWVPIGTLPEPGSDCECGSNCKCEKDYR